MSEAKTEPTFHDLLRDTLEGTNKGFKTARKDLNDIVGELGESVMKILGGHARIRLREQEHGREYVIYRLSVDTDSESKEIGCYQIGACGYPIVYGTTEGAHPLDGIAENGRVKNREELRQHFVELLTDRDSPIIVFLAWQIRQLEERTKT